jgi:hypothetical protein
MRWRRVNRAGSLLIVLVVVVVLGLVVVEEIEDEHDNEDEHEQEEEDRDETLRFHGRVARIFASSTWSWGRSFTMMAPMAFSAA